MNVLALVAHSDDEVIGCGGTLAKHSAQGDGVYVAVLADGVSSRQNGDLTARDNALSGSCRILGVRLLHRFDFKDNQLDRYPLLELVRAVEGVIGGMAFDRIYTHSRSDLNVDHRVVHDVALTLFRPLPGASVKSIFAFETLSATHWYGPGQMFSPQCFMDVTSSWEKKMAALTYYEMEMRPFPHARSKEAVVSLARFRGGSVGFEKAEAFEVIRILE